MRKGLQQSWNTLQLRLEISISVSNTARSACYIQGRSAFLSRQHGFTLYFELLSLTTLCLLIFMFNFFPEGSFKLKNVTRYDNGLPNPTSKTETRTGKYVYRLMRVREQFRFPEKKKTLTWHGMCGLCVEDNRSLSSHLRSARRVGNRQLGCLLSLRSSSSRLNPH